jgi:hypothetical protein
MGVGGQHHAPTALPPGKTLGRPQGRSGRMRKTSPPPGFDPRTVQPVASRYTDWAIAADTVAIPTELSRPLFYGFYTVCFYIYVLKCDFVSDCNLYTKRLHKYNGRRNIGCVMNVVYEPPEDGLI